MSGIFGRMRGNQPAAPAGVVQGGYAVNGNQGAAARRGTTPTTPQFPNSNGSSQAYGPGPSTGVHDCIQPNGGKPMYLCQPFVKAALVKGSFRTITAVPKYVDGMEWVAVNLVDFFHNINLFLGIISEHCTRENCQTMSAGPGMDYTWTSGPSKKQVKVPAPEYTDYVLTWAEKLIGDETMFPTKSGREFSPAFPKTAVHLYTQFLRIFAHLYHAHFRDILHLSLEAHLN
ncbi:MAG: Maintenance of ploidy protein mob2, partial [Cyphobasidiales sp. Tagirdzhanova-0007]